MKKKTFKMGWCCECGCRCKKRGVSNEMCLDCRKKMDLSNQFLETAMKETT